MSRTGWLGVPLGVTFNSSSAVYARMQGWKNPKGAVVHAWMDSSWFTNMFEVTGVDLKAGNLSFLIRLVSVFGSNSLVGKRCSNYKASRENNSETDFHPNGDLSFDRKCLCFGWFGEHFGSRAIGPSSWRPVWYPVFALEKQVADLG